MNMKQEDVLEHVDNVNRNGRATQQHYEPTTDEEKSLERRLNFKLDLSVVLILAIGFIVSQVLPANYQIEAPLFLIWPIALWHRQNQHRIRCHNQFS